MQGSDSPDDSTRELDCMRQYRSGPYFRFVLPHEAIIHIGPTVLPVATILGSRVVLQHSNSEDRMHCPINAPHLSRGPGEELLFEGILLPQDEVEDHDVLEDVLRGSPGDEDDVHVVQHHDAYQAEIQENVNAEDVV